MPEAMFEKVAGAWKQVYPHAGPYLDATGGDVSYVVQGSKIYRKHSFLTSGVLTVLQGDGGRQFEYLLVGGGASGGSGLGGGGGAGGVLPGLITLPAGLYPLTVGVGGASTAFGPTPGLPGNPTMAFGKTALGGGRGGSYDSQVGGVGGSGGGGGGCSSGTSAGGLGTAGQGFPGGIGGFSGGSTHYGGGGGGASQQGQPFTAAKGGDGGDGILWGGSWYAGGGGGSGRKNPGGGTSGAGGLGGGGRGAGSDTTITTPGTDGTGGGGGGADYESGQNVGGKGGNGVVAIMYEVAEAVPVLTGVPDNTQIVLNWTAAGIIGQTVSGYEIDRDGALTTVGNVLTSTVTGLTNGTTYAFKVRAITASGGRGAWSNTINVAPVSWNNATGGQTPRTFTRPGKGTWKSLEFSASGQVNILSAAQPFEIIVCGGGQGGPYSHPADIRGYNGSPGPAKVAPFTLTTGLKNVTVGGGGGGGQQVHQDGNGGGASGVAGVVDSNGGGSITTDARVGTNETFAGASGYGNGGGPCYLCPGGTGAQGVVVIAWQIGA
jgi:hypothetical protein